MFYLLTSSRTILKSAMLLILFAECRGVDMFFWHQPNPLVIKLNRAFDFVLFAKHLDVSFGYAKYFCGFFRGNIVKIYTKESNPKNIVNATPTIETIVAT